MITMQDLQNAKHFTIFRGPAEDPKIDIEEDDEESWDLFGVGGYSELGKRVLAEVGKRGVQLAGDSMWFAPQIDDCYAKKQKDRRVDDLHAILAYLREGGTVIRVPDRIGSEFSRFYAVARVRGAKVGKAMPEEPCVYCGVLWEGNFTIHEYSDLTGEEVPLCNECGGYPKPSCGEIWERLALRREEEGNKSSEETQHV